MKQVILLAGAAMLASAGAAQAKPPHAKHGKHNAPAMQDHRGHVGYGQGHCPPGLKNKNPQCMPPGQYKKLFEMGQRVPYGYDGLTAYNRLPYDLRNQYQLDPYSQYIYRDDYLYRVDPKTMIVNQILRAVL